MQCPERRRRFGIEWLLLLAAISFLLIVYYQRALHRLEGGAAAVVLGERPEDAAWLAYRAAIDEGIDLLAAGRREEAESRLRAALDELLDEQRSRAAAHLSAELRRAGLEPSLAADPSDAP
ncbi:MAG: hypothetical protein ACOCX4_08460 [Planctomycetota bacterium]